MAYLALTYLNLCAGCSNVESLLDEEDTESDTPPPNRIITQADDTRTLK
jgi:hypothetical protein